MSFTSPSHTRRGGHVLAVCTTARIPTTASGLSCAMKSATSMRSCSADRIHSALMRQLCPPCVAMPRAVQPIAFPPLRHWPRKFVVFGQRQHPLCSPANRPHFIVGTSSAP